MQVCLFNVTGLEVLKFQQHAIEFHLFNDSSSTYKSVLYNEFGVSRKLSCPSLGHCFWIDVMTIFKSQIYRKLNDLRRLQILKKEKIF